MRQAGPQRYALYPGMPYTYYTRISRDDALAIRAWLNTLPAVHNPVEADQLPFPFNIRLRWWSGTGCSSSRDSSSLLPENRGMESRCIADEGLGHCGLCHTPKNFLGGDRTPSE